MNIEPDIREELPRDLSAISEVHRAAFGRDAEGMLVDRLRLEGLVVASVVAVVEGRVAGNAVFSEIVIRTAGGRNEKVVALAPVAVMPEFQRRGLGSRVIDAGLKVCAKRDCTAAFVLGEPAYYGRFGFGTKLAAGFESPYRGPHWMAVQLVPGALEGMAGIVEYPAAFKDL